MADAGLATTQEGGHSGLTRAQQAYHLHVQGWDWPEIAKAVGFINGAKARMQVYQYIKRSAQLRTIEQRELDYATHRARYEDLMRTWWPAAHTDLAAAAFVLKVLERMGSVLDLEDGGTATVTNQTIVLGGDVAGGDWVAKIKELMGVEPEGTVVVDGEAVEIPRSADV
jgi:hypothetical protein